MEEVREVNEEKIIDVEPEVVEKRYADKLITPKYIQSITGRISAIFRKLEHISAAAKQTAARSENPTAYAMIGGFLDSLVQRATTSQYQIASIAQAVKNEYNETIDEINTVFPELPQKEQIVLTKILAPVTGIVELLDSPEEFELKKRSVPKDAE